MTAQNVPRHCDIEEQPESSETFDDTAELDALGVPVDIMCQMLVHYLYLLIEEEATFDRCYQVCRLHVVLILLHLHTILQKDISMYECPKCPEFHSRVRKNGPGGRFLYTKASFHHHLWVLKPKSLSFV
jgi:hypothetical protein